MNSILIIAHTPLASALKSVALHTFAEEDLRVDALDVPPDQPPEHTSALAQKILVEAQQVRGFTGTLVLSDIVGATPCNVAQQLSNGMHIRCVAGANVPMLLRALTYAQKPLQEMAQMAVAGGSQGALELN